MISEKAIISAADDAVDWITLSPVVSVEFAGFVFTATVQKECTGFTDWMLECEALAHGQEVTCYEQYRHEVAGELFQFAVRTVVQKLAAGELIAVPAEVTA
jgi:hypothetical protein